MRTPEQRHKGDDILLLAHRKEVYEKAKERNPKRWTGAVRSWGRKVVAWLNPENESKAELEQSLEAA